jgi:hypothetical protein
LTVVAEAEVPEDLPLVPVELVAAITGGILAGLLELLVRATVVQVDTDTPEAVEALKQLQQLQELAVLAEATFAAVAVVLLLPLQLPH